MTTPIRTVSRTPAISLLLMLLASAIGGRAVLHAQADEQRMYVSVLDRHGVPALGLTADRFIVREDGVLREVLRVGQATEPMQIALVVDNSWAARQYISDLRVGLESFVDTVAGDHEVALMTIGDRPTIVVDYRRSAQELQQAVKRVFPRPDSGGHFRDTIYSASRGLLRRQPSRPVILAVTSEGPDYSSRAYQAVVRAIEDSGATLHAIVLTSGGASLATSAHYRDMVLDQGTKRTGGERHDLLQGQRLVETLQAVAAELVHQYEVIYARPDMLIPPDRIEVEVTGEALVARGRLVTQRDE